MYRKFDVTENLFLHSAFFISDLNTALASPRPTARLSLCDDWVDDRRRRRRRRRPTPGAEASVGIFAGDGHSPGIPTRSLPFLLCETERQTLTIWLFDAY
jgi:hypothetical protein